MNIKLLLVLLSFSSFDPFQLPPDFAAESFVNVQRHLLLNGVACCFSCETSYRFRDVE